MGRLGERLRGLVWRLARGEFSAVAARLRWFIWSEQRYVVLRRDLARPFDHPRAPAAFTVRPYRPDDAEALFDPDSPDERVERDKRESWMKRGLAGCHVAVLEDGRPAFMQWVCTPAENGALSDIFEGSLPVIEPGTVLMEGAYTPPRLRRVPLMPAAMARIAEEGRRLGARWAMVSIGEDATSMIKAAQWAGFEPWKLKCDRRRLFRSFVTYSDPPPSEPVPRRAPAARRQPA